MVDYIPSVIEIWNPETGKIEQVLKDHGVNCNVRCFSCSPNSKILASGVGLSLFYAIRPYPLRSDPKFQRLDV